MRLLLQRLHCRWGATIGALYVGWNFECFTLEDPPRVPKVAGETRIPAGRYPVTLRTAGGMHARYQERFPDFHQGMLWIREIPGFEWVYLHIGNTVGDTEGCPLVGVTAQQNQLVSSTTAYKALYGAVVDAAAANELEILVRDDRELLEAAA